MVFFGHRGFGGVLVVFWVFSENGEKWCFLRFLSPVVCGIVYNFYKFF